MVSTHTPESWSDLRTLLDEGVPLELALGLDTSSQGASSSHTFEENMTIRSIGGHNETFRYKLPRASDVEILGTTEPEESLTVLPPFLDLRQLLEPVYIPETDVTLTAAEGVHLRLQSESGASDYAMEGNIEHSIDSKYQMSEIRKRTREESLSPKECSNKKSRDDISSSPELLECSGENSIIDLTQDH